LNIFLVNGIISIIAATSIAKKKFSNKKNILLIENSKGSTLISKYFVKASDDFYKIQDLLILSLLDEWDEVHYIKCPTKFISLETPFLTKLLPFIKGFTIILRKKKIKSQLFKLLQRLKSKDKLIVADNTFVWRFWYKSQCKLAFIEHGASTYKLNSQSKGWRLYIKKLLTIFSNYNYVAKPDLFYLTDGGMKKYQDKQKISSHVSFNIQDRVEIIFSNFYKMLQKQEFEAYKELCFVRKIILKKKLIIYLPNTAIDSYTINDYFNDQLGLCDIDPKNTFIIIKKHNRDKKNHLTYVKKIFPNCYEFKHSINKHLPAEFLLYFFDNSKLFGTYSSAHLYSYWWLNKIPLFVNPENKYNVLFESEYRSTLIDFKKFNIMTNRS